MYCMAITVTNAADCIEAIVTNLADLGVRRGDLLLVHSSLKALGPVPGGPEIVILGLLAALGARGTLLLPALSYASVSENQPRFDPASTPVCVGAIPEHFRTRACTLRSVHPTHSVCAAGAKASEIVSQHHLDRTPVGRYSPFRLLRDLGGKILMLGCGLKPNTSMHGVEELSEPPYLLRPDPVRYIICGPSGEKTVEHRRHSFAGYAQRYDRLEQVMQRGLRRGRVLEADCWLIDAEAMWQAADLALRGNPLCFVERLES